MAGPTARVGSAAAVKAHRPKVAARKTSLRTLLRDHQYERPKLVTRSEPLLQPVRSLMGAAATTEASFAGDAGDAERVDSPSVLSIFRPSFAARRDASTGVTGFDTARPRR